METDITPPRLYRVVWHNLKNGDKGILFPGPLTHKEACTCKSKVTPRKWRRDSLEEIKA